MGTAAQHRTAKLSLPRPAAQVKNGCAPIPGYTQLVCRPDPPDCDGLAPGSLFFCDASLTSAFSATPEHHRAQTERLFAGRVVGRDDAAAVSERTRELLQQAQVSVYAQVLSG